MKTLLKAISLLLVIHSLCTRCSKPPADYPAEEYWLTRNPYAVPGTASLVQPHIHTTALDGSNTPEEVVAFYASAGYHSIALTDHDLVTTQPAGLIALQGSEISPSTGHVLSLGSDYFRGDETGTQAIIDGIVASGGIAILNHPNRDIADIEGHTYEEMLSFNNYTGIEIHNAGAVILDNESGYALMEWDSLLKNKSTKIWGFASDDFHSISEVFAFNTGRLVVFSSEPTGESILEAIRTGNFVADVSNFGVTLKQPSIKGSEISLSCPGATSVSYYGPSGLMYSVRGESATYRTDLTEQYIRAEVTGSYAEPFDAAPDLVNRWSAVSGSWSVSDGILRQSFSGDTRANTLILKRHLNGDCVISCDILCAGSFNDSEAGIVFNGYSAATGYCLKIGGTGTNDAVLCKLPDDHLSAVPASINVNTWYSVKIEYKQATGTIKARVWAKSAPEPASWQMEVMDTGIGNGFIALRCIREAKFDNLFIDGFRSYYQPITVE